VDILRVVGVALLAAVLLSLLRRERPEIAVQLGLVVGVVILLFVLPIVGRVVASFRDLSLRADVEFQYMSLILKVIGIAYIAEFGAQVCRDAGEGAVAAKVELAGKALVLLLALPIVYAILDLVGRLLP